MIDPEISAEKLLTLFESEQTNIFDILHNNESLLGILLGFGKHNAMLFQRRENLIDDFEIKQKLGIYQLASIKKKFDLVNTKLKLFHPYDFDIIASRRRVMFLADPNHSEKAFLKMKYDQLNRKINEIYAKPAWFEQTLIQLVAD